MAKKNWWVFLLLAFLIFVVYANAATNGFVTDDGGLVKEGPNLLTLRRIFIDPDTGQLTAAMLRTAVYSATYFLFGALPWAFRLSNILFHLGTTFFAYLIVKKLVNQKTALLAALIFAVHPLLAEGVVWISGGGYVQVAFLFLLSFWFYLKGGRRNYLLSIIVFVLTVLSLNRAIILALIFPIYEFSYAVRTGGLKKNWKKILPFLMISGLWLVIFLGAVGSRASSLEAIYYHDGQFYNPLLQWPLAIGSYLSLLFWPGHLTYVHTNTQSTLGYFFRIMVLLGYFGAIGYSCVKKRLVFFWLVFFLIPLLPTLTPFKIAFIVAERYVYLSTLGIIVLVSYFLEKMARKKEWRNITVIIFIIIIIVIGLRTIIRNTDWKDDNTLWQRTSEVSQDSSQAHFQNGYKLAKAGNFAAAEKEFTVAIEINPKIADYYFNLGVLYLKTNRREEALKSFQKALELKPNYPDAQKGVDLLKK